jgi:hypothetical protein
VLVQVSQSDPFGRFSSEQGRGAQLSGTLERALHNRIFWAFRGSDIQQLNFEASVGEMRGDLRTHRSGSNNCHFAKRKCRI